VPAAELSPPANLRDLGGTPVEGGVLRPGVLWRADDLSCVPEAWARTAVADGLAHVVDLRSADEAGSDGRGPLGRLPVTYHHVPLADPAGARLAAAPDVLDRLVVAGPEDVAAGYLAALRAGAGSVVTLLGLLAGAAGATVVHCAAGKDRTGMVAAAVLTVLGAPDEAVVADYAASAGNLPGLYRRLLARYRAADAASLGLDPRHAEALHVLLAGPADRLPAALGAPAATMSALLDLARRRHGGIPALLREHGLHPALTAALRARLVVPCPG
jgi:hypothetical protein